jgi:AAA+ ATPase superfamily predicted ATPase
MNKFFDRTRALASLSNSFDRDEAGLYILCGRRRLGKTTFLRHFAQGKRGVYHMADRSGGRDAIDLLAQSMARSNDPIK